MKLNINEETLQKYGISTGEFLILLLAFKDYNIKECIDSVLSKGVAEKDLFNKDKLVLSDNTKNLITSIIIDSDKEVISSTLNFEDLANKLREIYPKGRKEGTTYQWRDSTAVIAKKLKTLIYKYKFKFTEEQAINATKSYVEAHNGDYRYMQLLKYFILKADTDKLGDTTPRSDFMSYIENAGQEEEMKQDWTSTLK